MAFYCLAIMVAAFLLQVTQSVLITRTRLLIGASTDRRVGLLHKLILGIQTVKNYVWEQPIIKQIERVRRKECCGFARLYCLKGLTEGIFHNFSILLSLAIILIPLSRGTPLESSTVFTALTVVDYLSLYIVQNLSDGGNAVAEYYSVIARVQEVLPLEEKEETPLSEDIAA